MTFLTDLSQAQRTALASAARQPLFRVAHGWRAQGSNTTVKLATAKILTDRGLVTVERTRFRHPALVATAEGKRLNRSARKQAVPSRPDFTATISIGGPA
ncbi:hypothetical protein SAMN05216548_10431 [Faunimonas pinastri]|uniref:Uncharacterized protein n=1 Tax=Faunimonas pinastri TaxID=1855383 RepID=A0A1H9F9H3_9HYPH|nr:hypothetical protein [Faunimonas pinastri]SEQ34083.1 hypothetical protein SAMN05216548_10431 [Faunimonas pinastri]